MTLRSEPLVTEKYVGKERDWKKTEDAMTTVTKKKRKERPKEKKHWRVSAKPMLMNPKR